MRQIKEFVVLSILTVFVLFSCKKEKQDSPVTQPPETLEKIVTVKVIEYGSDLPIEGATLSICDSSGNCKHFTSNANGECFLKTDSLRRLSDVTKDWYVYFPCLQDWEHTYTPDLDSFTIRLVLAIYATVHVKDTNSIVKDQRLILSSLGTLYPEFTSGKCYTGLAHHITLRPQIDTTLVEYLVWGNADNEFTISKGIIWGDFPIPVDVIHREIKYIPKANNLTVEIIY
jgi:hypothetical protein